MEFVVRVSQVLQTWMGVMFDIIVLLVGVQKYICCSNSNNYPASQNIGKIILKLEINNHKRLNSDYEVKNN